jgi:uncharacterized protein (TIGR02611 family)
MVRRTARKLVVFVIGGAVLLGGVVMLVTPGPGIAGVIAGFAILATEFVWARVLLKRLKQRAKQMLSSRRPEVPVERNSDFEAGERTDDQAGRGAGSGVR